VGRCDGLCDNVHREKGRCIRPLYHDDDCRFGEADLSGIAFPEDPDPSGLKVMVIQHKEMFDAYVGIGFTREEAIQLVCTTLTVWAMNPVDPDA
jgi:hypothetical protein